MTEAESRWRAQRTQQLMAKGLERFEALAQVRFEARSAPWGAINSIAASALFACIGSTFQGKIMEPADLHAHAKITEGTPAELLPHNLLQHRMQQICTDVFVLQCKLVEARREIASLQGRVNECGAGAGCCAQAARIEELEAQLEAVGAGGVGPMGGAPAQPFALLVRKKSWNEGQWECAPSGCPEYGRQWADERVWVYTAPQPAAQAQEDAPDMFWDADDTENFAHEVQDIVDGYCSGEIVTIECAKRMPNFRVLITGEGDSLSYEHIDAASAAQQGTDAG